MPKLYDLAPLVARFADEIDAADAMDVDVRTLRSWLEDGGVDCWRADKVAMRCGLHPALVWTDWYDTPADEDDGYANDIVAEATAPDAEDVDLEARLRVIAGVLNQDDWRFIGSALARQRGVPALDLFTTGEREEG